jgi:hypothetical protein
MAHAAEPLPQTAEFNRDIRPILSDTCYKCHGPDKAKRKADLRLDLEGSAKAKLGDHFPIVAGQPSQSEVVRRIMLPSSDEDNMPPTDSALEVTPRQVALLVNAFLADASPQAYEHVVDRLLASTGMW